MGKNEEAICFPGKKSFLKTIHDRQADKNFLQVMLSEASQAGQERPLRSRRTLPNDNRECCSFYPHLTSPVRLESAEHGRNTIPSFLKRKARQ